VRSDEVAALGGLAGEAAEGITVQARDVHRAVAGRAFAALDAAGPLGGPAVGVRAVHDAIATGSYGAARELTGAIVRAVAAIGACTRDPAAPPLAADARGRALLGALAGAWGDRLAARGSVLDTPLALIVDDRRRVTGRLAVFIHGLGETELSWRRDARRRPPYGDRLSAHGITPVYVRYNSGRPIEASGAALADALADAVSAWPVAVDEISLIGHSMGGLVARAACHRDRDEEWCARVRRTVFLGSPHTGAPLARAAALAERAVSALPETRAFAAPLRVRSAGVRDLAHGSAVPFLAHADHFFVSASVTRDPEALAGRLLGDLLVLRHSAWAQRGRRERVRFDPSHYRHLGAATHLDLLDHPAVAELLEDWIVAPRQATGQRP
jgi:pimeloyl-ACP methyl ester carboxylesterase